MFDHNTLTRTTVGKGQKGTEVKDNLGKDSFDATRRARENCVKKAKLGLILKCRKA